MEPYQRQQFDFLLATAVERWIERLEHRYGGSDAALVVVRDRKAKVEEFVEALFADFLLDGAAGSCFVLQALSRRMVPSVPTTGILESHLSALARQAFAELLEVKAEEALEQRGGYQPMQTGVS